MGVLADIKRDARNAGINVSSGLEAEIEKRLNALFYLPAKPELEGRFVTHVKTRGTGDVERQGLHASNMLVGDEDFCLRAMVLSSYYRQLQGKEVPLNVKRIFEEGNAIHEKWQRLFLRGGLCEVDDLDSSRYVESMGMSYSPDAILTFPDLFDGKPVVCEIKSVNSFAYEKQDRHPSGWKQCLWYMYCGGWQDGFVLRENKNTQQFAVEAYHRDDDRIAKYIERADAVRAARRRLELSHRLVARPEWATSYTCETCSTCVMKDVCWKRVKPERLHD